MGVDIQACIAKADDHLERRLYRCAAREYEKALKGCTSNACVDLDEEIAILHKRASCWEQLKDHQKLLDDAERLLSIDASDAQALQWQKRAAEEVEQINAEELRQKTEDF